MRIIRYRDQTGAVGFGAEQSGGLVKRLEGGIEEGFTLTETVVDVHDRLAPIEPRAILCIGLNYRKHAEETGAEIPTNPVLFMKNPAAAHDPGEPVLLPSICMDPPQVDYEVELAVVIGKRAKHVKAADALDYVLGYTIANDVSARTWQKKGGGGQWIRGKSFDTFCPLGPAIVTTDEISDPQALNLSMKLNGETMQDSTTADMIFSVRELIEYLSTSMTLLPGTVLLTGTPSGVGAARNPQVFLKPGDEVEMTIEPIGVLRHGVEGE